MSENDASKWQSEVNADELDKICKSSPSFDYLEKLIANKHQVGDIDALCQAIDKMFELLDGYAVFLFNRERERVNCQLNYFAWFFALSLMVICFIDKQMSINAFICLVVPLQIVIFVSKYRTSCVLNEIKSNHINRKALFVVTYLKGLGYEAKISSNC